LGVLGFRHPFNFFRSQRMAPLYGMVGTPSQKKPWEASKAKNWSDERKATVQILFI